MLDTLTPSTAGENRAIGQIPALEGSDCGKKHYIYGESKVDSVAKAHGIERISKLPIDPKLAALCDAGDLESYEGSLLEEVGQ